MSIDEDISEARELASKEPLDEFRQHGPSLSPSIERLTILIRNLLTRVRSPSVRRMVEETINQPLPPTPIHSEMFNCRKSRWAALEQCLEISVKAIKEDLLRPADEDFKTEGTSADPRKVFVVHGRHKRNRDGMFAFLRSIGLDPMEWEEAMHLTDTADPFIGEILAKAFGCAQAIVVLLTPDDVAYLQEMHVRPSDPPHEKTPTGQARPNVLFEAGMAFGKHPTRTVLVEIGKCRPFSDIAGRYVIHWDNSTMRRQELAQALRRAGCEVQLIGTDWHTAGEFDIE